jgi:hypothetical protein
MSTIGQCGGERPNYQAWEAHGFNLSTSAAFDLNKLDRFNLAANVSCC